MTAQEERDLGFGSVVARESRKRLLNRDGTFNVERRGLRYFQSLSLYHTALSISWPRFLAAVVSAYLVINVVFACAFLLCGHGALYTPPTGMPEGRFLQAFFFSVETFGTIGYGNVYPVGVLPGLVMVVEALTGLLVLAMSTGLIFARFSRPTARIRFSTNAVVAPYRGITALMLRIVNERRNQIVEVEAQLLFSRRSADDGSARVFDELGLERRRVVFFPLAWTIVHPIDETSPLFGLTPADLREMDAEFLVLLKGIDETFSQTVHARSSYRDDEITWNAQFTSMFNPPTPDGVVSIDMDRLDAIERMRTGPAPLNAAAD
ncbi:MAG TPA: ion channel [Candidatus Tumulicola sp.]|nr:ion channel [Candidatus Tumulicola sp.]HSC32774.1 ion channel [Gemmatimonadaceae bacterium]